MKEGFPSCSVVKDPPVMQGMQVQSLFWEDALEKEIAHHSDTVVWIIPWTEEPGKVKFIGSWRV